MKMNEELAQLVGKELFSGERYTLWCETASQTSSHPVGCSGENDLTAVQEEEIQLKKKTKLLA